MPNILLTRIDNRLVHGKVGVTWTKTIGANLLLVANDEACNDQLQQQLMSVTAKSSGAGIRFFSIEKNRSHHRACSSESKNLYYLQDTCRCQKTGGSRC